MGAPPPGQKKGLIDLRNGALLQMAEAATLGLPLEVWKTRMGRFRNEGTLTAFRSVYSHGGGGMRGVKAFWAGFSPKMVESSTKGAVLMVAKEGIKDALAKANVDPLVAAVIAGAGGGVAQTIIMAPMVGAPWPCLWLLVYFAWWTWWARCSDVLVLIVVRFLHCFCADDFVRRLTWLLQLLLAPIRSQSSTSCGRRTLQRAFAASIRVVLPSLSGKALIGARCGCSFLGCDALRGEVFASLADDLFSLLFSTSPFFFSGRVGKA